MHDNCDKPDISAAAKCALFKTGNPVIMKRFARHACIEKCKIDSVFPFKRHCLTAITLHFTFADEQLHSNVFVLRSVLFQCDRKHVNRNGLFITIASFSERKRAVILSPPEFITAALVMCNGLKNEMQSVLQDPVCEILFSLATSL